MEDTDGPHLLLLPFVGGGSFDGEADPRPDWLPKLCAGWEAPACFHLRVQFEELRVLGACYDRLYCLRFPLIWKAQSSILVLVHWNLLGGLQHCHEEPDGWTSSLFFLGALLPARCILCPTSCLSFTTSFSFGTNRSLTRDSSCVDSYRCTWATRSIRSASVSPAR